MVQELVLEILGSFLASSWVSGQNDVKISFLRDTVSQSEISLFLSEATCSDYTTERMSANLCNAVTLALVKDASGGALYPNYAPYNIDCDATIGTSQETVDAGETWLLTSDLGLTGVASLWIADKRTKVTTRYDYIAATNWVCRKYFQLPDGSRKRLLWANNTTGAGVVWRMTDAYAQNGGTVIATLGANWSCRSYWHDGTTGRALFVNVSTYETRIYTLDANDVATTCTNFGALTGYVAEQYSRPYSNRVRIMFRNVSDLSAVVWKMTSADGYVSSKTYPAYTGYTPMSYWHTGTDGKMIYRNTTTGTPYQRILDANDTDLCDVATVAGASALTTAKLSQSFYGLWTRHFDGGWMSSTQTPFSVMRSLYAQYASPRWIVGFTTIDTRAMQLERGDLIAYSCDQLRDENALPLVNQIGRVLELTRDPITGTCQLKLLDTGACYTGTGTTRDRTRY